MYPSSDFFVVNYITIMPLAHYTILQLAAIEVAAHLHNDDTVAALETYNEACG